jgi:rRNA pseudouridine-1189 N-methylase Emg1 (Nep1/Mra1 family)
MCHIIKRSHNSIVTLNSAVVVPNPVGQFYQLSKSLLKFWHYHSTSHKDILLTLNRLTLTHTLIKTNNNSVCVVKHHQFGETLEETEREQLRIQLQSLTLRMKSQEEMK